MTPRVELVEKFANDARAMGYSVTRKILECPGGVCALLVFEKDDHRITSEYHYHALTSSMAIHSTIGKVAPRMPKEWRE